MLFVNYGFTRSRNETDGPFSLPADNFDLAAEWGPSAQDITAPRLSGMFNMDLWPASSSATSFSGNSATPYTITTGRDDNHDTVSNDRPPASAATAPAARALGRRRATELRASASASAAPPTAAGRGR